MTGILKQAQPLALLLSLLSLLYVSGARAQSDQKYMDLIHEAVLEGGQDLQEEEIARKRFLREAKAAAAISYPVSVCEAARLEGVSDLELSHCVINTPASSLLRGLENRYPWA